MSVPWASRKANPSISVGCVQETRSRLKWTVPGANTRLAWALNQCWRPGRATTQGKNRKTVAINNSKMTTMRAAQRSFRWGEPNTLVDVDIGEVSLLANVASRSYNATDYTLHGHEWTIFDLLEIECHQ